MAASFDPALGSATDEARYLLGDKGQLKTESGSPIYLLQDETIDAMIRRHGFAEGVARLADGLALEAAQLPTVYEESTGAKLDWSDRVAAWRDLAKRQRSTSTGSRLASGPYAGGMTKGPDMSGFSL